MASRCKHCFAPVLWVQKPNGSWHSPFNAPEEMDNLDFQVSWDNQSQDWSAKPVDQDLIVKLSAHDCPVRTAQLQQQAAVNLDLIERGEPLPLPEPKPVRVPEPEVRVVYQEGRTVFRNPSPEQYEKVAPRLAEPCPTCSVPPFVWCVYTSEPDKKTKQLHTSRRVPV